MRDRARFQRFGVSRRAHGSARGRLGRVRVLVSRVFECWGTLLGPWVLCQAFSLMGLPLKIKSYWYPRFSPILLSAPSLTRSGTKNGATSADLVVFRSSKVALDGNRLVSGSGGNAGSLRFYSQLLANF